ncbi:MAG: hypothetical protein ACI9OJ_004915 [Myxococcota bacterium]|jgi:hypothetical protein
MGVAELVIVTLLLSLGGAGLDAKSPKGPAADEILRCAPADAEGMVYWHAGAAIPAAMSLAESLRKNTVVRTLPDGREAFEALVGSLDQFLSLSRQEYGFDPLKDLGWAAGWLTGHADRDPDPAVILAGRFSLDLASKVQDIGSSNSTPITIGTARGALNRKGHAMVVTADQRYLLLGKPDWIKECLSRSMAPKTPLVKLANDLLSDRPYFMLALRPSEQTRAMVAKFGARPAAQFIKGLVTTHRSFGLAIDRAKLRWDLETINGREARISETASIGIIELLRAGQHATRGLARLGMVVLHSYAGQNPWVDWALKHQKYLLDTVFAHSGDGNFEARVTRAGTFVTTTATAKHVDRIVPVTGLATVLALAVFLASSRPEAEDDTPASAKEARPRRKIRTRGMPPGGQSPDGLQPIPTP